MKRIQTFHAFTTVVPNHPLEHLWTPAGIWTDHERTRELSASEVEALLASASHYRLVEARPKHELRWYPRGDYGFWHHHAKLHTHYAVSEWVDAEAHDYAILFQEQ